MSGHDRAREALAAEIVPHLAPACDSRPPRRCDMCDCFGQIPHLALSIVETVEAAGWVPHERLADALAERDAFAANVAYYRDALAGDAARAALQRVEALCDEWDYSDNPDHQCHSIDLRDALAGDTP